MPAGWTTRKLADIATIQGGGTPRRSEPRYFGGGLPWVTPTDLGPIGKVEPLGQVAEALTKEGLEHSSARLIPAGSVLFSSRASIGKVAVTSCACATNQGFINLTPKRDAVCAWFLAFLLARYTGELKGLAGKTTFLEIPRGKFKDFTVAVPSLAEQRHIVGRIKECVERVSEIEKLRSSARAQQQYLSASLIESEIQAIAAYRDHGSARAVGELVTSMRNGRSIAQDTSGRPDGAVLTLTSVRNIDLRLEYQKPIVLSDRIARQFDISEGDVFVSRANTMELVGLAAIASAPSLDRLIYPDLLIKLKADPSLVLPRYLAYALRSAGARKQIQARAFGSSQTMVKISGARLREVTIPVPPLAKQAEIVARLDTAHQVIDELAVESAPGDVEALRGAILRKAFAGEL